MIENEKEKRELVRALKLVGMHKEEAYGIFHMACKSHTVNKVLSYIKTESDHEKILLFALDLYKKSNPIEE